MTTGSIEMGIIQTTGTIDIGTKSDRSGAITIGNTTQTGVIDILTEGAVTLDSGIAGTMEIAPSLTTGTANIAKALTTGTLNIGNDAGTGNVVIHGAVTFPDTPLGGSADNVAVGVTTATCDICTGSNDRDFEYCDKRRSYWSD